MRFQNEPIPFPILIGDIGGTNARFQIVTNEHSEPVPFPNILTKNHKTLEDAILSKIIANTSIKPNAAIIAAAGPIENGQLEFTNNNWTIRPENFMAASLIHELVLLNDFEAQALATMSFDPSDIIKIGKGEPVNSSNRVILGPGTGLGVAGMMNVQNTWIPIPGEGGHMSMGPQTKDDFFIWPFLQKQNDRISAEQLVSGRGILNIYLAVAASRNKKAAYSTPEEITTAAAKGTDIIAKKSVELFCSYLGRIAGDLALTFLARGGVYVAGGIGQHVVSIMKSGQFRNEFENKYPLNDLLKSIPTYLIMRENAALLGLASFAQNQGKYEIDTKGRRWQS